MRSSIFMAALLIALPALAADQKPVTKQETVVVKATIEAIDHSLRSLVLKGESGEYETIYAGPEIKRFDELKVGDKVTFKVTESVAISIRKPGEPAPAPPSGQPAIERGTGSKPSGKISEQQTATVLVKAIDMNTPAVTVQSADGRVMTIKVKDKGLLKKAAVGDRVDLTYTTAVLVSVE